MRFFMRRSHKKYIQICVIALLFAFLVPNLQYTSEQVYAKTTKQKIKEAKAELAAAKNKISNLENKADKTEEDIAEASSLLDSLISAQKQVSSDIDALQAEIDQNNVDLVDAQASLEEQYESMKTRVQFMYENSSTDSIWSAIISSSSFSEMINRVVYISEVNQTDRQLLEDYETSLQEVEELGEQLASNMEDLQVMLEDYQDRQSAAESTVALLEEKADEYADQIAEANSLKSDIEDNLTELERQRRNEEAAAANTNAATYNGGGTGSGGVSNSVAYLSDDSYNPGYATSISPDELVSYALQFVGNPYVWGGNSLTNGCDCSGFVHLIYQHFGISTPRYSQSFKSSGQPVSFNNMKAGDVVVYPGHVAIYMGNGCIVEAQSTKAGITCTRSVKCHTITAIRRLL